MAAAGGVIRNWEGRIVDAFTFNLGKCSITRAELTGAVTGIERAWDLGVRELTVQLDSLCAIKLLSDSGSTNHQHASIGRATSSDHLANRGHDVALGLHQVDLSDPYLIQWQNYDRVGGFATRRIVIS
ncbi:Putative ribonuclease H protein At1g65750 [Linum perenne]